MAKKPVQISIAKASEDQLRAYSIQQLGGEFAVGMSVEDMRIQVSTAEGGAEVFSLMTESATPSVPPGVAPGFSKPREIIAAGDVADGDDMDEMVTILIQQDEKDTRPVPVSVNGIAILIPRGKPVSVKRKFVEALRNAVREVPIVDDEKNKIIGWRPTFAYPFSVSSHKPEIMALGMIPSRDVA